MNIEPNYKNKKHYNVAKPPMHQNKFWTGLIWLLCRIFLSGKKYKVEKINMDGLKSPYMMLSNHMAFIDFELAAMGTWPYSVSNVVNIDGYVVKWFLMEWIGCIATRKFTTDIALVKSIRKVTKRGDILGMYPEARYSPCGITSFLPDSLGKLVKMNKVPVVAVLHRGNHLYAPVWDVPNKRKVPMHTTLTQILTAQQAKEMSVDQINEAIRAALQYDDYQYQKDNGILITDPFRARNLHKVLYKCPHCGAEAMDSAGTEIFCAECGKRWVWQEDGYLKATQGETEFDHIPDWFRWERQEVKKEIENGTYHWEDEVEVYSLPRCWRYIPLGKAKLTHDIEKGFLLEGHHRGADYFIRRTPDQSNSLHVEYGFPALDKTDYVDISTENDSFYCKPTKRNCITKLALATEELYLHSRSKTPTAV